jgi:hypothetical protein
MKKVIIVFVAVFCIHNLAWSQEQLRYFESDNAFYLDYKRLSDGEIRQTLSSNSFALDAWERGNIAKRNNKGFKIATPVLLVSGGVITIVSFSVAMTEAAATIALFPLLLASHTEPPHSNAGAWIAVGLVVFGAGIVTGIAIPISKSNYRYHYSEATNIYNKGVSKTAVSLHIGATGNGLGFSLKF